MTLVGAIARASCFLDAVKYAVLYLPNEAGFVKIAKDARTQNVVSAAHPEIRCQFLEIRV